MSSGGDILPLCGLRKATDAGQLSHACWIDVRDRSFSRWGPPALEHEETRGGLLRAGVTNFRCCQYAGVLPDESKERARRPAASSSLTEEHIDLNAPATVHGVVFAVFVLRCRHGRAHRRRRGASALAGGSVCGVQVAA